MFNKIKNEIKTEVMGMNIGNNIPDKDISEKIATLAQNDLTDIINIDTENVEHVAIVLD